MGSHNRRIDIYQLSDKLGITVRHIHRMNANGRGIPSELVNGRLWYNPDDVVKYLKEHNAVARFVAEELTKAA